MDYSFWGNTSFSAFILNDLINNGLMPKAVVTFSPKEFGRKKILQPNPVENIAKQHKIKIIYADNISNDVFLNESKTIKEYVGIIASFGKIIPPNVLKIFSKGLINVHPSLLPKYRGPSPIQSSILNNDQETGATIFILDDKMDHGPIIGQMSLTLNIDDDYLSLSDKLAKLGSKLIINLVPKYLNGEITIKPQEESLASYSNKFVFENCKIDWSNYSTKVYNFIRALNSEPGVFTTFIKKGKPITLKIIQAKPIINNVLYNEIYSKHNTKPTGSIVEHQKRFFVKTFDNFIEILEVHQEGKHKMTFSDFYNGNKIDHFE